MVTGIHQPSGGTGQGFVIDLWLETGAVSSSETREDYYLEPDGLGETDEVESEGQLMMQEVKSDFHEKLSGESLRLVL
jgi:hypothetical protein